MTPTAAAGRPPLVWEPPPGAWQETSLGRFAVANGIDDYAELVTWSVADVDRFWSSATEALGVLWTTPPTAMHTDAPMPGVRWFPGATLNYAEQALVGGRRRVTAGGGDGTTAAIVAISQTRDRIELSWDQLDDAVARCRAGLQSLGVGVGDRVVAYAPNIPETLVALLATASLGAVWASCAPEFGVRSVIDRVRQIEPKVLIAVDGYRYGAKSIDRRRHVDEIVTGLPSLTAVVDLAYLYPEAKAEAEADPGTASGGAPRRLTWTQLTAESAVLTFDSVPADHPLYVLFSSGTTGLPKAIVHGHGGIVAEHLKVLGWHHDLGPADRFFWFSTTGWMMWNYLVSGLLVGSTVVLFDGDPAAPDLDTLWIVCNETATTWFGTSATFLVNCRKQGVTPERGRLRAVGSTGSPLPPSGFEWVAEVVGVPPISVSGGTDVCTAFLGTSAAQPVRSGELGGRLLGAAVRAFDDDGAECPPGTTGELVVTAPMPSMPVGFWGEPGVAAPEGPGPAYRAAYFERFPGVWCHGDWITFTDDGACVVTGRSDATLNRGGVRLGTSDFYSVVESFAEITDSLVVHLDGGDDPMGRLLLFVVVAPGFDLDDELTGRLRRGLAGELSPRHVPDAIEAVPAIPRTLSGKKLELPVKRILGGADPSRVAARESLADPTALDWFVARASAE